MANVEFGTGKTVLILTIVAACFAVLWPKIFYPMLVAPPSSNPQSDNINGCCDVIFETDVNAIKIMYEMCGSIFKRHVEVDAKLAEAFQEGKFSKRLVDVCRSEVFNICGIDIADILKEKVRLGHTYRQILDEIRSYNISACLRKNFGVSPGSIGTPRWMPPWRPSRHLRQERPLHLRPEIMHPALRERGRAIPQSSPASQVVFEKEGNARPPPIPGMRPPMGGPGHVVPPPKVGATMSIIMPLYTIGIVIFSMYTIMKVFVRKTGHGENYKDFNGDSEFRRVVFAEDYSNGCGGNIKSEGLRSRSKCDDSPMPLWKAPSDDATRLVMTAITGLLAEVDQQLSREGDTQTQYSTDLKGDKKNAEEICTGDGSPSRIRKTEQVDNGGRYDNGMGDILHEPVQAPDDSKPKVKVIGLETVAECEGGQRWSRPASPDLGVGGQSRGTNRRADEEPETQDIFLEGSLPTQSQLLVTDSKTQTLSPPDEDGPETPIILSGKVTLSLISLDVKLPEDAAAAVAAAARADSRSADEAVAGSPGAGPPESDNAREGANDNLDDEATTNYTTATMSEGAEASPAADGEDTVADLSNIDAMEVAEMEEEIEEEEDRLWNGVEGDAGSALRHRAGADEDADKND